MKTITFDDDNSFWLHNKRSNVEEDDSEEDEEPETVEQANFIQQAINGDSDLTKGVLVGLHGPSGMVSAADEAFAEFSGLDAKAAAQVKRDVIKALTQPQGWSTDSIVAHIYHHWTDAGFDAATAYARAANVARTEVRSIASEFKRRLWREEEAERKQTFMYHVRGANDHRTTKQSHWVRARIPRAGLPLEQVEAILDEALMRTKRGDFSKNGALSGVPGRPITLPVNFQRRGFLIAFNDRDQVFRVA